MVKYQGELPLVNDCRNQMKHLTSTTHSNLPQSVVCPSLSLKYNKIKRFYSQLLAFTFILRFVTGQFNEAF